MVDGTWVILCATEPEFRLARRVLQSTPLLDPERGGSRVVVLRGGMGRLAAARAARGAVSSLRPMLLVDFGGAGALDPGLKPGDLVKRVLTVDAPVRSDLERQTLSRQGYEAVTMETDAVEQEAQRAGVCFAVVRIVTDVVGGDYRDLKQLKAQYLRALEEADLGKLAAAFLSALAAVPEKGGPRFPPKGPASPQTA